MHKYYIYINNNCFYIKTKNEILEEEKEVLFNLIDPDKNNNIIFSTKRIKKDKIEIGPLLNFKTPWSSNSLAILNKCGIYNIVFIEKSRFIDNEFDISYDPLTEAIYDNEETLKKKKEFTDETFRISTNKISRYNKKYDLGLDQIDVKYYENLFRKRGKEPTNVELFDLAQSNSEHSRHWVFNGIFSIMKHGNKYFNDEVTLFKKIKNTLYIKGNSNSIIAFSDNASAIKGYKSEYLVPRYPSSSSKLVKKYIILHPVLTAETHNFPTGISPFAGAATGIGGRIRDNVAIGRGGLVVASTAGYSVGNLNLNNYDMEWEMNDNTRSSFQDAKTILIEASNGASDYGNKFGEPIIQGFTRSYGNILKLRMFSNNNTKKITERYEFIKPIMFTGGIGFIRDEHTLKHKNKYGNLIVRAGGPAYRIGLGGGSASSKNNETELDLNAVQRGDPEMENKLYKFLRSCIDLGEGNPILSIHDQGAGGMANVTKEIVEPNGAIISLNNVILGDNTLTQAEIWSSEHQEQVTFIIHPKNIELVKKLAIRESVPISFIGIITNTQKIEVYDKNGPCHYPVDLNLQNISGSSLQKKYKIKYVHYEADDISIYKHLTFKHVLNNILKLVTVGSKRFLTTKVDRSVSGLIAQQQCVGPLHIPLEDVAVVAQSHFATTGIASAIGEQPLKGFTNIDAMVRMTVGEMLTNLVWAKISSFDDIKCSGNWMWPFKGSNDKYLLYEAVTKLSEFLIEIGISIDGGKDSLSMSSKVNNNVVKSPRTLVMSAYVTCPDINKVITPDFKGIDNSIIFVDISDGHYRLGGSAFAQTTKQIGSDVPTVDDPFALKNTFIKIQELIEKNMILSGHDRSDGGLISTILEMCFAGNCGCDINIQNKYDTNYFNYFFNEELGLVIEVESKKEQEVIRELSKVTLCYKIGKTQKNRVKIQYNNTIILKEQMYELRDTWEETSFQLELLQAQHICVKEEQLGLNLRKSPSYNYTDELKYMLNNRPSHNDSYIPKVCILREEGSNGDSEMRSAFYMAGFDVWDMTMNDLINNTSEEYILDKFRGIVFVGGFSYSDVFGAGVGWYNIIKTNIKVTKEFERFKNRNDTFSFGVCNGCQLMSLLGWIEYECRFLENDSERFESRFSNVVIQDSPSIMLKGMQGCQLGVWVAHKEGRCVLNTSEMTEEYYMNEGMTPIRYIDDYGVVTDDYPFNPNGSDDGITAICSKDGRHLAMMPHPERCFLNWQLPYIPKDGILHEKYSPWMCMFDNAFKWCLK